MAVSGENLSPEALFNNFSCVVSVDTRRTEPIDGRAKRRLLAEFDAVVTPGKGKLGSTAKSIRQMVRPAIEKHSGDFGEFCIQMDESPLPVSEPEIARRLNFEEIIHEGLTGSKERLDDCDKFGTNLKDCQVFEAAVKPVYFEDNEASSQKKALTKPISSHRAVKDMPKIPRTTKSSEPVRETEKLREFKGTFNILEKISQDLRESRKGLQLEPESQEQPTHKLKSLIHRMKQDKPEAKTIVKESQLKSCLMKIEALNKKTQKKQVKLAPAKRRVHLLTETDEKASLVDRSSIPKGKPPKCKEKKYFTSMTDLLNVNLSNVSEFKHDLASQLKIRLKNSYSKMGKRQKSAAVGNSKNSWMQKSQPTWGQERNESRIQAQEHLKVKLNKKLSSKLAKPKLNFSSSRLPQRSAFYLNTKLSGVFDYPVVATSPHVRPSVGLKRSDSVGNHFSRLSTGKSKSKDKPSADKHMQVDPPKPPKKTKGSSMRYLAKSIFAQQDTKNTKKKSGKKIAGSVDRSNPQYLCFSVPKFV